MKKKQSRFRESSEEAERKSRKNSRERDAV